MHGGCRVNSRQDVALATVGNEGASSAEMVTQSH
jgi:hypothetical protein